MIKDSTQLSDMVLLERFRAGDREAFDELFRRYRPLVTGVCLRELGNTELAEDAVSAVFLVLYDKASSLSPKRSISSWLFRVSNLCVRNARKTEKRTMNLYSRLSHEAKLQEEFDGPEVNQALKRLRPAEREAILLHYVEGLTTSEISARLGINEGACRMRLRRALEALRRRVGPAGIAALDRFMPQSLQVAGTSEKTTATVNQLASALAKTLALQTAARVTMLVACGFGCIGVAASGISKFAGHSNKAPATVVAKQTAPPSLPPVPPGKLLKGATFEVSFYRGDELIGRKSAVIDGTGHGLATCELSGWPQVRRGNPKPKDKDSVGKSDVARVNAKRSDAVLKFGAEYGPMEGGGQEVVYNVSVLTAYDVDVKMTFKGIPSGLELVPVLVVKPDQAIGYGWSSVSPTWVQRAGHPWERESREEEDKNIGRQMLHMGESVNGNAPDSDYLGIALRPISGLTGAAP